MMDRGITSLDELQRMKKKMEQTWGELFEQNPGEEQDGEDLPKFEGTRRISKSRPKKANQSH
jgi:hypothetical protein